MAKKTDWYWKVYNILSLYPDARDDDFKLYFDMCNYYTDIPVWAISFEEAMLNNKEHGLPSYEGITRARRRVQADYPELRGNRYDKRMEIKEEFREEYGRR